MTGILIGIFLLILAGLCIASILSAKRKYKLVDQWLLVEGEIVDNISVQEDYESLPLQITTYKYRVTDIEYEKSIRTNLSNFLGLNTFVANYQKGDKVDILYDPSNPKEAILSKYDISYLYLPFGIGFVCFVGGLMAILLSIDIGI